jgi:hypothetical protein
MDFVASLMDRLCYLVPRSQPHDCLLTALISLRFFKVPLSNLRTIILIIIKIITEQPIAYTRSTCSMKRMCKRVIISRNG